MINGSKYDWESITALAPNGIMFNITEINYSDEQEIKEVYGKGSIQAGYGRGNYKASGSLKILLDEWERLASTLGDTIYDHDVFPITVSYAAEGATVTDLLPAIKITKVSTSNSQGSSAAGEKSIDFMITKPIVYNGKSAKA